MVPVSHHHQMSQCPSCPMQMCIPCVSFPWNCLSWRFPPLQSAWKHQSQGRGWGGKTKYHDQVQLTGIRQYKQLKLASVFLKYTTFTLQYHIYHRLLIPLVQVEFKRNTFTSSTPSHSLIYSVIQQIFADFLYMQSSVESPISITTNPDIYNNSNFQLQPFRECII